MSKRFLLLLLLLPPLAATVSGYEWHEEFSTLPDDAALQARYPSAAAAHVVPESAALEMRSNGQSFEHRFPAIPLEREIILTVRLRVKTRRSFCRISFGGENISWNHYQGGFDLHGEPDAPRREVQLVIRPNPVRGGTYDIRLDGRTVSRDQQMRNDRCELPRSIRIGYLDPTNDGVITLDRVSLTAGAALSIPPEERIAFQLPRPAAERTFRSAAIDLPFTYSGDRSLLQNYRAVLHPADLDRTDRLSAGPAAEAPLCFGAGNTGNIHFENLPFGMYVLRISATGPDGADVLLKEELISRIHPKPRPPKSDEIRWAIDTHADRFDRRIDLEIPALAEAGANWTRLEFSLYELTASGKIDFTHHDKIIEEGEKHGIHFFALLCTKPHWSRITPLSRLNSQPTETDWEKVCSEIMSHYRGRIRYYEIWNEPIHYAWNGFEPGIERQEQYSKLFFAARRAADSVDPEIKLMGPCLTPNMNQWLSSFIRTGAVKKADFLSVHVRKFPDCISDFYSRFLRKHGCELPIFITEGANDPRALVASFAGETPAPGFAYTMRDKGMDPKNYEHNNGMLKYDGLPKNRFIQYQFLATMLNNADYVGRIFTTERLNGYLFREAGIFTAVVWAGESDQLPDTAFAPGVERFDTLGNPFRGNRLESWADDVLTAPFQSMAYLRNLPPESDAVQAAAVNETSDYRLLPAGNGAAMEFSFANLTARTQSFRLTLDERDGIRFHSPTIVTTAPGEIRTVNIPFSASPETPPGEIMLDGLIEVDGRKLPRRFGPFRFFNPDRLQTDSVLCAGHDNGFLPANDGGDIHTAHSTGVERDALDQDKLSQNSSADQLTPPASDHPVFRLRYSFSRPDGGWSWMARRYSLKQPVPLSGIPVRLKMRIFMQDNINHFPTTLLFTFRDPSGKEIRVEGGEIFWSGWREYDVWLPSFLSHGYIHSVAGGNNKKAIDALPLEFTGVIVNLVPLTSARDR